MQPKRSVTAKAAAAAAFAAYQKNTKKKYEIPLNPLFSLPSGDFFCLKARLPEGIRV